MKRPRVRPPAMAGEWYPGDRQTLERTIDGFLAKTKQVVAADAVVGLLAPHAGVIYSGQAAAWAYRQVQGQAYDVVVLIGLAHGRGGRFGMPIRVATTALYDGDAFQTPLGEVPIDREIVQDLHGTEPDLFPFDDDAHRLEHSLELHLPFLQRVVEEPRIVPILMQTTEMKITECVAQAVARCLAGRRALVVASSDLSHRPSYEVASRVDRETLAAVTSGDAGVLSQRVGELEQTPAPNLFCAMCGLGATMTMLSTARLLGATEGQLVHYSNSGDMCDARDQVVGYGAVAFTRATGAGPPP